MQTDERGRRIFPTEAKALAAQQRQARSHGICSGVVRVPGGYALLFDVTAFLNS